MESRIHGNQLRKYSTFVFMYVGWGTAIRQQFDRTDLVEEDGMSTGELTLLLSNDPLANSGEWQPRPKRRVQMLSRPKVTKPQTKSQPKSSKHQNSRSRPSFKVRHFKLCNTPKPRSLKVQHRESYFQPQLSSYVKRAHHIFSDQIHLHQILPELTTLLERNHRLKGSPLLYSFSNPTLASSANAPPDPACSPPPRANLHHLTITPARARL